MHGGASPGYAFGAKHVPDVQADQFPEPRPVPRAIEKIVWSRAFAAVDLRIAFCSAAVGVGAARWRVGTSESAGLNRRGVVNERVTR